MEEPIEPKTLARMQQLGWVDGNERFSPENEKQLTDMGYRVPGAVRRFLNRFGFIWWYEKCRYQTAMDNCHTDPIAAGEVLDPELLAEWEKQVNARLCPVAAVGYGSYVLVMDEHGRVFGANPDEQKLHHFNENSLELIEMLFGHGGGISPLSEEDRWTGPPATDG